MIKASQMLVVGRFTTVYGIKGWLKIHSATEPKENIFDYQPWYIADQGEWQKVQLDDFRLQGKGYVGHLAGVNDRDKARDFCRTDICIEKNQLPALPGGEYYWHELEGLKVYSVSDGQGSRSGDRVLLGKVKGLMATGANDVLMVSCCTGSLDKRERLVPWLTEYFQNVDLDKAEIEVLWDPTF
jgi:16S rRNA processing protein RimM